MKSFVDGLRSTFDLNPAQMAALRRYADEVANRVYQTQFANEAVQRTLIRTRALNLAMKDYSNVRDISELKK